MFVWLGKRIDRLMPHLRQPANDNNTSEAARVA